jgi:hypothetical protein
VQKPAEPVRQPPQLEQKPEPAQKPALKPVQPIQKIHLSNTGTAKLATADSYYYTEHEPVYYKGRYESWSPLCVDVVPGPGTSCAFVMAMCNLLSSSHSCQSLHRSHDSQYRANLAAGTCTALMRTHSRSHPVTPASCACACIFLCLCSPSTAGMAVVFDGYVQVMSCSKKTVYKEGKMQAIVDYKIYDDDKTITPSEDQFIAKPYTMDLILRKANDY